MKITKDRRHDTRWPVTLLVKCSVANRRDVVESDMWAKDVNEKGMKLEWTPSIGFAASHGAKRASLRSDDIHFEKGRPVEVQELFYDEDGSPKLRGKISWVHHTPGTEHWSLGVQFSGQKTRARQFAKTFNEFIGIVKDTQNDKLARRKRN